MKNYLDRDVTEIFVDSFNWICKLIKTTIQKLSNPKVFMPCLIILALAGGITYNTLVNSPMHTTVYMPELGTVDIDITPSRYENEIKVTTHLSIPQNRKACLASVASIAGEKYINGYIAGVKFANTKANFFNAINIREDGKLEFLAKDVRKDSKFSVYKTNRHLIKAFTEGFVVVEPNPFYVTNPNSDTYKDVNEVCDGLSDLTSLNRVLTGLL